MGLMLKDLLVTCVAVCEHRLFRGYIMKFLKIIILIVCSLVFNVQAMQKPQEGLQQESFGQIPVMTVTRTEIPTLSYGRQVTQHDLEKIAVWLRPSWNGQIETSILPHGAYSDFVVAASGPSDQVPLVFKCLKAQAGNPIEAVIERTHAVFKYGLGTCKVPCGWNWFPCLAPTLYFIVCKNSVIEVMEKVPGDVLRNIFFDTKYSSEVRVKLFGEVGAFLSAVHQQNMDPGTFCSVLHGDCSWSNIMVWLDRGDWRIKLIDAENSAHTTPSYGTKQPIVEDLLAFVWWSSYVLWEKSLKNKQPLLQLCSNCIVSFLRGYVKGFDVPLRSEIIKRINVFFMPWLGTVHAICEAANFRKFCFFRLPNLKEQKVTFEGIVTPNLPQEELTCRCAHFGWYEKEIQKKLISCVCACKNEEEVKQLDDFHARLSEGIERLVSV